MNEVSLFRGHAAFLNGASFVCSADNPFELPLHKHDTCSEMLLIEEGEGEFTIGGTVYRAGPGTLLFYQSGVWHREQSRLYPFRAIYVAYRGLRLGGLPEHHFLASDREPLVQLGELFPAIQALFMEMIGTAEQGGPESALITGNLLGIALAKLARQVHYVPGRTESGKPSEEIVAAARRYMEQNYCANITLDTLAAITFSNKYHLAHVFKAELGISPIRFLISCRLDVAKHYLRATSLPIREIAELSGYESEPSFYKVFRKETGLTPMKYRIERSL